MGKELRESRLLAGPAVGAGGRGQLTQLRIHKYIYNF